MIKNKVSENNLSDRFIFHGFIEKDEDVCNVYTNFEFNNKF